MFPNPRLLQLAQKSRLWLILTISLGFISGLLVLGQARTVSQIISRVFLDGSDLEGVSNLLLVTLILFSVRAVLTWLSSLSAKTIAVEVKSRVRNLLLNKLADLGPAFLQGEQTGELNQTVVDGVESLDSYFSQYLPQLVLSALVPLSILIFVFPMDLLSGLVLLVTAPLIPYFMYLIGSNARAITNRQYSTLSRLAAHFLDSLQGLTTLRLFNRAEDQVEKIRETSDQYRLTTMKVLRVTFLSALVLELLATLSTAVVAVEIGLRLLYFRVSLEQALFLLMIAPEFYIPLRLLGARFHAGMEGQSAAERIFEILDTQPLQPDIGMEEPRPLTPVREIEFSQVSFTYPGGNRPALKNVQLKIQQGEKIALVGESGAGKSSLAKLLLGFFPPSQGEILINGHSLRKSDLKSWREQVAWVSQDPAIFLDTIAANIRLARPDADHQAVASAASAAHLADFIESLPEGYETLIGEGGARLSGGQAQRLALARAFLKDAPILLLDEPTSQLDPLTESKLAEGTAKLMSGRTVITIAHRLNTVFEADRILVFKDGEIIQEGTHQELYKREGEYQELVNAYTGVKKLSQLEDHAFDLDWKSNASFRDHPVYIPKSAGDGEKANAAPKAVLVRLLSFFTPYWREVLGSVLLGFLTIGSSVALMAASAWLISMAALHPSIAVLSMAIVGVRLFGITRGVSRYCERLVSHNLTFKIITRLRVWFYQNLVPLAPARTMNYRSGDLLSRITSDIKTLEDFFVRSLAPPLVALLIGFGTALFLLPHNAGLALSTAGIFLLAGLALPLLIRILAEKPGRQLIKIRSRLAGELTNFVQGLPDLLVFGGVERHSHQLEESDRLFSKVQLQLARISGINSAGHLFLGNLALWLVLVTGIPLVRAGEIAGVMLAALALLVLSSFEAVQSLPLAMETLASSLEAGRRLLEILDAEPEVIDPDIPQSFPQLVNIQVRKLSFNYPGQLHPALDQVSFQLKEGEFLALVGPSGAGKSTLTHLLLRFWGQFEGEILVGDHQIPLAEIDQDQLRQQISVVTQSSHLFNDSVLANIALGNPGASREKIEAAARLAQVHQTIAALPDGYLTQIGERGLLLSAGERQRISIARAVLKDGPILLLDEPTANLDPITEKELLATLFDLAKDKTTLLITHRLTGLDRADRILVFDQGRIVEQGTEKELLDRGEFFKTMWATQNRLLNY